MIRTENLTKYYGSKCAVNSVSFNIRKGEVFALLGPNGAGKTTTIKMLTTLSRPTEGKIFINNLDVVVDQLKVKRLMAVVPQVGNFDRELSVYENMLVYGMLYGVKEPGPKIEKNLDALGLLKERDTIAEVLSGGMQRRLLIAKALLSEPDVLFLDEPTVGLDPHVRREIWDIIRNIRNNGKTILMTTHYIEEAEMLCDRIGILSHGSLIAIDTPGNLKDNIGRYVVEIPSSNGSGRTERVICRDRAEAEETARRSDNRVVIRPANLEDVFIQLTGEMVEG